MTFFARPNLDDIQFKQSSGTTLTLSGSTIISSNSGLTLTGDYGHIPVVVTGETDGYVLTYKSGQIVLAEPSSSGAVLYNGASPTTCSVGGLQSNTPIAGCSVVKILEMILSPTVSPTLSPPFATLTLEPSTTLFEVGTSVAFIANGSYNQGSVSPVYCGGPSTRTGLPVQYMYTDTYGLSYTVTTSSLSSSVQFSARTIQQGSNVVTLVVSYSEGDYPRNSDGSICGMTKCPSGTSDPARVFVNGILPYFWGKSTTPPTASQSLIDAACSAGNVCVGISASNVVVMNYNASGEYIWLAIPSTSPSKTKWQGDNSPSNCGTIPGDLFKNEQIYTVNSPSSCWSGMSYKFYISNYPTSVNYKITFKNY